MKVRRAKRRGGVIGLDLSLTAAGACWLPWGWDGDTEAVVVKHWGYPLTEDATREDQIDRMIYIAEKVVPFCQAFEHRAVYVENYAFSQASTSATTLRELGGIVKREFRKQCTWVPIPVTAAAARKTLLQRVPKEKQKEFAQDNVRRLKGEALYWTGDEIDALVIANHGVMLEGGTPLSFPGLEGGRKKRC